jgi:hypothetical protein
MGSAATVPVGRRNRLPRHERGGFGVMTLILSATAIFARRKPGGLAKCPRERTRFAKANPGADLCHRERRPLQQALGAIHSAGHMVAMRRRAE